MPFRRRLSSHEKDALWEKAVTYHQSSRAPASCRDPLCGYLEQRNVQGEPRDRCLHNIPMHGPSCAWHRTPEQIALINAREAEMAQRVVSIHRRKN